MKKREIIISTIAIIFVILIGAGFWVWKLKQEARDTVNTSGNSKEFDISQWKAYRNENYGFKVKYPGDWEFDEFDGISFFLKGFNEVNRIGISKESKKLISKITGDYLVNISVYTGIKKNHNTLEEWRKYDFENAINNKENHYLQKFPFSNKEVLIFERKRYFDENIGVTSYYFFSNDDGYEITTYHSKDSNGLAEKIISTLKIDN